MPSLITDDSIVVRNLCTRLPDGESVHKGRVLIIDDDELTTATFAQMLRLEGHEVQTAQNAAIALEDAPAFAPDAIIVDLHMPAMDGLTFVKGLRARPFGRHIPVAMVTGDYAMPQDACDSLTALGVTLCFKPLWLDDLVELANKLLEPTAH